MTVINQLDTPTNAPIQQSAQPQGRPDPGQIPSNEMVVTAEKKKEGKLNTSVLGTLVIIGLMIFGVVGGVFLVGKQQIFQSKAGSGWTITDTNLNFCGDAECILPSDLVYCPTVTGFELTSDSCVAQGTIDLNCSAGMSGYIYHCPEQKEGNCFQNKKYIGAYLTGQTVDVTAMADQFDCGTAQIEFVSDSETNISGGCGLITLRDTKCSK